MCFSGTLVQPRFICKSRSCFVVFFQWRGEVKQRDNITRFEGIAFHTCGPEAEICRYTKKNPVKRRSRINMQQKENKLILLRYAKTIFSLSDQCNTAKKINVFSHNTLYWSTASCLRYKNYNLWLDRRVMMSGICVMSKESNSHIKAYNRGWISPCLSSSWF